ncbi:colanic acid biosynthesis glycosyltransferase WcaI [Caenimonas sedimenti]|uniref:Colanic acid biosynthesis glycosyltransferase WcaI n=1 Tax=Caenimonas sedimenti TaxID=2596921 RepID=A0A562ZV98_9BURK|nr:glycosyltransferase WbuB [Caenimonas sedimenti]TWO72306.1 colanic acid biosynthesis glycosyltransferase WcaI [Caenimonas sedimenti]
MKILLYGINYAPELTGVGKYTGEMAEWLAARGHHVRVLTAPPYYPAWKIGAGYSGRKWSRERVNGVDVWRCPLWVPAKLSGLKRLVHLASFALSSLPALLAQLRWKPDVTMVVEPPLLCAPGALLLARLTGGKAWLHVQDYEVDAAFALGLLRGKRLERIVRAIEGGLMKRFDRVSSISGRMTELAQSKGVPAERVLLFANWVDVASIRPLTRDSDFRRVLGLAPEVPVALYSGNMGAKQGLEVLAETARRMQGHSPLRFVFCGDGAGKAGLQALCAGLANVDFLPLQPVERLGELLGLATIHLLPQRADAADLVLPSKLTGMLASGRPVLVTAAHGTELAQVVDERAGCGKVVPAEDADAMITALEDMLRDPGALARQGAAGRAFAEQQMSKDAVLAKLESDFLGLGRPQSRL